MIELVLKMMLDSRGFTYYDMERQKAVIKSGEDERENIDFGKDIRLQENIIMKKEDNGNEDKA